MEKPNIADLLKDCPRGMELDCTMYEDVYFEYVDELQIIHCYIERKLCKTSITFNQYGTPNSDIKSKCVIFPKGKTTWDGFIPPCLFNDGDILTYMFYNKPTIYIYRKNGGYNTSYYAAYSSENKKFYNIQAGALSGNRNDLRFATEEEKQKLFDVIKARGYKWDPETKTLEKLIKFKIGDRIKQMGSDRHYIIKTIEFDRYILHNNQFLRFTDEHIYELAPNKFDITTLKPFDKVLVRCGELEIWHISFFEKYSREYSRYPFVCLNGSKYSQCIPYKDNEHLLDTAINCNDYYKTW